MASQLIVWRHPRPHDVAGRCIGRTDVRVPARRAKRLARRIQKQARLQGWPRIVHTSPLHRAASVGRWLRRWGWQHVLDPALMEADFGAWDGLAWGDIARHEVDAWCTDFAAHCPGGGESLTEVLARAQAWQGDGQTVLVVGHAGWMLARRWAMSGARPPQRADEWPWPPAYGECWVLC